MKKTLAVAALGVAGFFGVAACGTGGPTTTTPLSSTAPTDNPSMAREIANIAIGKGGLTALYNGSGQPTLAYCDSGTVSHAPNAGTSRSATCGINYSDESVWKQTVTVTFDGHGHPIADSATLGTEVMQPTSGRL
jgi:hypothetical protein